VVPVPENRSALQSPSAWGALGVGLLAFAAYVLCATPTAYPLDSAELATAAFGLGVAHPPGEGSTLLWAKLFTLLPSGSVAFKVALSQAAAGALAAVMVFLLTLEATRKLAVVSESISERARSGVAAAAALAFAFAPGVVIVSSRAEVYALQTALSLGALWLALRAYASADARHAFLAAMLIGFGVGNHSMVAGLVGLGAVAASLPLLVRTTARKDPREDRCVDLGGRGARLARREEEEYSTDCDDEQRRQPGWIGRPNSHRHLRAGPKRLVFLSVAAFAVGLLVHAYLPLRAFALFAAPDRGIDNILWGDPRSWQGFWWMVSARTFSEKAALVHGNASPADLPFLPIEELGTIFVLLAAAGAYVLLRRRETRVAGLALLVGAAGSMVAALVGGLDPENPDIRGYLGPALALVAVLSGTAIAMALCVLRVRQLRAVLMLLFLLGSLARFPLADEYPNLRQARAAASEVGDMLAELPARAALFTYHFETGFLVGYHRLVEGARPDVAWAHLAFAGNSAYARRVSEAEPELRGVAEAQRDPARLAEEISRLDRIRPVRIEPNLTTPAEIRRGLGPAGDLWALASHTSPAPARPLPAWAVAEAADNRQTRGYLAWRNYIDAAWSCELGFTERARERFAELERLVPQDERFRELQKQCR